MTGRGGERSVEIKEEGTERGLRERGLTEIFGGRDRVRVDREREGEE